MDIVTDTSPVIKGKKRILLFGDSFTYCCRVRQKDTWPSFLQDMNRDVEICNFGVEGYSMGQCYLRFGALRHSIQYDAAVFMFVPGCDLERDINTYRNFLGWEAPNIMPRFVLAREKLVLIRGSYRTREEFARYNTGRFSTKSLDHFRLYDRFYIPSKYESPPVIGNLILYKLHARSDFLEKEDSLREHMWNPGSEAMRITGALFLSAQQDAAAEGKEFIVAILPIHDEIGRYQRDGRFREKWDKMVESLQSRKIPCADLMAGLSSFEGMPDSGHDGTHYGPATNGRIAELVVKALREHGMLP